jgi:hypothetical protein
VLHHGRVATYEYRAVSIPPSADREHARQVLQIHAEYGDWELARHQIWPDGRRKVTVRRRLRTEPLPPLPS